MGETQRTKNAFMAAVKELTKLAAAQDDSTGDQIKDIFAVHLRFLRDETMKARS
jgi:phosphoenolpyruvate-protein kinase (PTS system EI component)